MRVLFITNSSTQRCGVRVYGELWMQALREAGVEIDEFDGTYSAIQARGGGYLPGNVRDYDIVHLNWDPQAINHYLLRHFLPHDPPLSLFLHDVPPNSTCPVFGSASLVMAMEPGKGITVIEHAVPRFDHIVTMPPLNIPVIGAAGIRDDPGIKEVEALCKKKGWLFNGPSPTWLTNGEEIARLSMSHVNVCWYHTSGRGKSMAAMFCVAAKRPLVLSCSTMFSNLWPYREELYFGDIHKDERDFTVKELEWQVEGALLGQKVPETARVELAWSRRAQEIKSLWEAML